MELPEGDAAKDFVDLDANRKPHKEARLTGDGFIFDDFIIGSSSVPTLIK